MEQSTNRGAVTTLLAENEKAIRELQRVIGTVSNEDLAAVVDPETSNPECTSIQTVLTHVVGAGYSYCVYIRNHRGGKDVRPERKLLGTAAEYIAALDAVNIYTRETFKDIYNDDLEFFDQPKKILTSWGQYYDYEQLMEHAIVHILRHRRQIEGFLQIITNK